MGTRTAPIDTATVSQRASPRNPYTSNLTSALQTTSGNEARSTYAMDVGGGYHKGVGPGLGGNAAESQYSSGAQPISMNASNRDKPRRESLAGSMVTGMSWGGNSVGSWIRDDIIMQGTSPFAYQSPSYHSSSYLPKLEANFMRDFSCCGTTLPTLHDLLEHYERTHTDQMPPSLQKQNSTQRPALPDSKAALATGAATAIQGQGRSQQPLQIDTAKAGSATPQRSSTPATPRQPQQPAQQEPRGYQPLRSSNIKDEDTVGDMELDDDYAAPEAYPQTQYPIPNQPRMMQRSQFGQAATNRVAPLDLNAMNIGNPLQQYQGLRNSQPTTPVTAGRTSNIFHSNPTVSSVNTPTLSTYNNTHPLQQSFYTPNSSAPGTPGELEGDFMGDLGNMNLGNTQFMQNSDQAFGGFQFGNGNEMLDLCIDEPAKRLFSVNGGLNHAPPAAPSSASQLGDAQYTENSEIAKTIREVQKQAGVPDPSADGVPKPFHCPVIGCEKAYKNHNGLKYHKTHGHNTQKLVSNENGTYSIVDPDTLEPFPGTVGMEIHKPYRCDTCGKRYKNLNGLKYHKNHSSTCDPEIKDQPRTHQSEVARQNRPADAMEIQ